MVKSSPTQEWNRFQIFNSILPSNCYLQNTNATHFVIRERTVSLSSLLINRSKQQRCAKQHKRQVSSTHPAPEKEANLKQLIIFKKKKKRERKKKGKMNPLHQAVGYTDSWQCSKLLCRIFKNNNNKKNPKWNKQKLKTFRKTSRFQVWTGLSTCWSRRNKAHLTDIL